MGNAFYLINRFYLGRGRVLKSKYIKIEEPKVLGERLLLSNISCSRNVEKYFGQKSFWVRYDVDASILNIPVLSNVITVAWAVGADVYVGELDKSYFEALNKVKLVFKSGIQSFLFPQESMLTSLF